MGRTEHSERRSERIWDVFKSPEIEHFKTRIGGVAAVSLFQYSWVTIVIEVVG